MPIYASSDESTEDGSFMSSDQQRHSDSSSVQTASSCPSGYLNDVDQQYRHPLLSLNTDNEQASHAPRRQFLGFDDSSLKDSTLNPGYNVYSPLSPTASEECTESNYHHLTLCSQHFHMLSVVLKIHSFAKMLLLYDLQEDDEAELSLFRIERKEKNGDMLPWNNYTEVLLVPCALLMIITYTVK